MKIYTRCVYGWQPDGTPVLEDSDSFEYEGPVLLFKSSPSPPPAPDFRGAAQETAAGSLEAARAATQSNRIDQYTPYGNQVFTQLGPDKYRSDLSLTPLAQRTLDSQLNVSQNLGNLTEQQLGRVNQQYSQPIDLSSVDKIADESYAQQTARLDPQWAQNTESQENQLANQGLVPGGEAYDNAMRTFNQGKNDAYGQARLQSINTMPQTYQLATAAYDRPLNTLNAIRTGAQIQNPTFQAAGQQQATPGANYLGAAQSQGQFDQGLYNAEIGQNNAFTSGLVGLGGAAATFF